MKTDAQIERILSEAQTIAVVGMKAGESDDAFRVPLYMRQNGYRVIPVNPKLESVLGEPALPDLGALGEPVDIVNIFRASENVPDHIDEVLAMDPLPRVVWMQLGIHHGPSAARLRAAGVTVVQDRCIMVDHRRLLGEQVA